MRRVINDLLYDTETATLIYTEDGTNRKLYRTSNNNFFKVYPTNEIRPISEENAKEYLGFYSVEKYIEIFGTPREA